MGDAVKLFVWRMRIGVEAPDCRREVAHTRLEISIRVFKRGAGLGRARESQRIQVSFLGSDADRRDERARIERITDLSNRRSFFPRFCISAIFSATLRSFSRKRPPFDLFLRSTFVRENKENGPPIHMARCNSQLSSLWTRVRIHSQVSHCVLSRELSCKL